jgi:hypothetical protein
MDALGVNFSNVNTAPIGSGKEQFTYTISQCDFALRFHTQFSPDLTPIKALKSEIGA